VRAAGEDVVLVALNFSGGALQVDGRQWGVEGNYRDIFTNENITLPTGAIELKAWGYTVLEKK
jgi:hypothetical protein